MHHPNRIPYPLIKSQAKLADGNLESLIPRRLIFLTGIVGEVSEVLSAFMRDELNNPRFYMPGYRPTF
jgi:hypothetical protein